MPAASQTLPKHKFSLPLAIVVASFIACALEGAARKWILPSEGILKYFAYFSKDMLLALCVFFPINGWLPIALRFRSVLSIALLATIMGCLFSLAGDLNLVGAVLTVRSALALPVLALIVAIRLPKRSIYVLALVCIPLAILNAAVGTIQFFSPAGAWINQLANENQLVATASYADRIRASGTFSYITGYGNFSIVQLVFGLVLFVLGKNTQERWGASILIFCAAVCGGATVSRGVGLGLVVLFVAWATLGKFFTRTIINISVACAVLGGALYIWGYMDETQEILSASQRRNEVVDDSIIDRIFAPLFEIPEAADESLFGQGIGTEQVAGNYSKTGRMAFTTYESEWSRIIMEIGVVGLLGVAVTYLSAVLLLYQRLQKDRTREVRGILYAVILACCLWAYTGVIFNHVSSYYFWLLFALAVAYLAPHEAPSPDALYARNRTQQRAISAR